MIAEGALDGVAGVSGIHVFPTLPSGTIATKVRPCGTLCPERKRLILSTVCGMHELRMKLVWMVRGSNGRWLRK